MSRLRQVHKHILEFSSFEEPDPSVPKPAATAAPTVVEPKVPAQPPAAAHATDEEDAILEGALDAIEEVENFGDMFNDNDDGAELAAVTVSPAIIPPSEPDLEGKKRPSGQITPDVVPPVPVEAPAKKPKPDLEPAS